MEVPARFCNVPWLKWVAEQPSGSETSANYSTTIAPVAGHAIMLDAGSWRGPSTNRGTSC